jgi:C_GCAxxG_C_C family probable redox protein
MTNKKDIAATKFLDGCNCAQAVLCSFCEDLGLDEDFAMKAATGFGGGMGRKEEVCGAVTGGILVLGIKHGRGKNDPPEASDVAYGKVRELMDRFCERRGTFICRKLLNGCELASKEGHELYKEQDLKNKVCRLCVEDSAEIVETLL